MKKKMSIGITVLLIFTMCICCVNKVSVSADSVTVNHQKINRSGKVFKIKGNTIYFRERKGPSPEKWGKMQKAKMTASTKFYKMTKFDADCKAKKGTKAKALKSAKDKYNYNYFYVKKGKIKLFVYDVGKFVG